MPHDAGAVGGALRIGEDADGDGLFDLVVDGWEDTWVFAGSLVGSATSPDALIAVHLSPYTAENQRCSVTSDLDGDASTDLLVRAPYESPGSSSYAGAVGLFRGPLAGAADVADADRLWAGEVDHGRFGDGIEPAGDVDGDGLPDLFVTAEDAPDLANAAGDVRILLGAAAR